MYRTSDNCTVKYFFVGSFMSSVKNINQSSHRTRCLIDYFLTSDIHVHRTVLGQLCYFNKNQWMCQLGVSESFSNINNKYEVHKILIEPDSNQTIYR